MTGSVPPVPAAPVFPAVPDIECIGDIQFILQWAYAEAFPEKEGREFKVWFDGILKLNGAKYID